MKPAALNVARVGLPGPALKSPDAIWSTAPPRRASSAATTSIALHSFAVIPAGHTGGHTSPAHAGLLELLAKCVVRKSTGPIGVSTRTRYASHGNEARSRKARARIGRVVNTIVRSG